jgi:transglutaminase-like putative cysteine protease
MSIHVALNHVTHYHYDRPVNLGPQVIRLRPAPHSRTRILSYSMRVEPGKHFINWQQDPQSNYLARLVFPEKTSELRIEVDLVAEMSVLNPFDFFLEPEADHFPFEYDASLAHELAPYRHKQPLTPRFETYLGSIPRTKKRTNDFLVELNQRVQKDVAYLIRMEHGV